MQVDGLANSPNAPCITCLLTGTIYVNIGAVGRTRTYTLSDRNRKSLPAGDSIFGDHDGDRTRRVLIDSEATPPGELMAI